MLKMSSSIHWPLVSVIVLLSCAFFSCTKPDTEITKDTPKYVGTMSVDYDGKHFDNKNVSVQIALSEDASKADIKMNKVKFVPAMPVTIDVIIPDVPVSHDSGEISSGFEFSGTDIVPWAFGGPYNKFRVFDLKGSLQGNVLSFSLIFEKDGKTSIPTSFTGTLNIAD